MRFVDFTLGVNITNIDAAGNTVEGNGTNINNPMGAVITADPEDVDLTGRTDHTGYRKIPNDREISLDVEA
jgi:hypothetical protein